MGFLPGRGKKTQGKQLEAKGQLDQAVAAYTQAGDYSDAARILMSQQKFGDAGRLLLQSLGVPASQVGLCPPDRRKDALTAGICFGRAGEIATAVEMFVALGETERAAVLLERNGDMAGAMRVRQGGPASVAPAAPPVAAGHPAPPVAPPAGFSPPDLSGFGAGPQTGSMGAPAFGSPMSAPAPIPGAPPIPGMATAGQELFGDMPAAPGAGFPGAPAPAGFPAAPAPAAPAGFPAPAPTPAPFTSQPAGAPGGKLQQAQALEQAGQLQPALQAYLAAREYAEAGRVSQLMGRPEKAASYYIEASLPLEAANCYAAMGDQRQALDTMIRVPKKDPRYREAACQAVDIALDLGVLDFPFEQFISKFIDSVPENDTEKKALYNLAKLFLGHKQKENAQELFEKIPDYSDAQEQLQKLNSNTSQDGFAQALHDDMAFRGNRPGQRNAPGGREQRGMPGLPGMPQAPPGLPPLPGAADPFGGPGSNPGYPLGQGQATQYQSTQYQSPQNFVPQAHGQPGYPSAPPGGHPGAPYQPPGANPWQQGSNPPPGVAPPPTSTQPTEMQAPSTQGAAAEPPAKTKSGFEKSGLSEFIAGNTIADRYLLEKKIGKGGMAVVFKAKDTDLDIDIALKVFNQPIEDDPTLLHRFKQELVLSRQLTHPNIIRLHDIGIFRSHRYLTMELLSGNELKAQLGEPLDVQTGVDYLIQACEGLQFAHDANIVHRDVKPQNFFVTDDNVLKVMDFGIAKRQATEGVTVAGMIAGTPNYMSPEQINGFSTVTTSTDIYALGCIAYEMFTGVVPFTHPELMPLLMMHLTKQPVMPRERNPQLPEVIEAVIMKLMEKDPANRYPTCRDLADELRTLQGSL